MRTENGQHVKKLAAAACGENFMRKCPLVRLYIKAIHLCSPNSAEDMLRLVNINGAYENPIRVNPVLKSKIGLTQAAYYGVLVKDIL